MRQDILFALRTLSRKPGFTMGAVLTLALAIGASTSIYSIAYGVLLQPLPYPDGDRIVQVAEVNAAGRQTQVADPNFEDLRDQSRSFAAIAEYANMPTTILAAGAPMRTTLTLASARFFDVFQTPPLRGRVFEPAELHMGAAPVALISEGLWRRAFSAAADLSALSLRIGDKTFVVAGVMPARFNFPEGTDVWTPREQYERYQYRSAHNFRAVARLASGVALANARTDVTGIAKRLKDTYGKDTTMVDASLVPLREQMTGSVARPLIVLLSAVGCLVAIACANIANLLLVRLAGRRREMAVRASLGAGAFDLARPLVAEVALVVAAGGAIGLWLGSIGPRLILELDPGNLPRTAEIGLSVPVVLFTIGATAAIGIVLSVAAAWRARRSDVIEGLRENQRGQTATRATNRVRQVLVIAELAASLVLLIGAALLGRSLALLLDQNPGFRTEGVLTIDLSSTQGDGSSAAARLGKQHDQMIDAMATIPGVVAAGGINHFPLQSAFYPDGTFLITHGNEALDSMEQLSKLWRDPERTGSAEFRVASAGYFNVMDIPLVRGRMFDDRDAIDAPHVALISEALVRSRFAGVDPIGQRIQFGNMDGDLRLFTIVGIVGDLHEQGLDAKTRPIFYANARQRPTSTGDFTLVVRTNGAPESIAPAVRVAIQRIDPTLAPRVRTVDRVVAASVADRRFSAVIVGAFAASAFLLAIAGLYGVLSYAVSQRTNEFGIRLALGAQRRQVSGLVLKQAGTIVAIGSVIGIALAIAAASLVRSMLFGLGPTDPLTFIAVTATLAITALAACLWPALRATRVNPLTALRAD